MILNIKVLNNNSEYLTEQYADHTTYYTEDSGLDIFCPEEITIQPNESKSIKLGIACEAFRNQEDKDNGLSCAYYLYPRSSISKTPLRLANSVGIIDSGYRGELMAIVDNINNPDVDGGGAYTIQRGQRLFQICAPDLRPFLHIQVVTNLSNSERGSGAFGSTGN